MQAERPIDLLPCPFCGGAAERIDFGPGDGENEGGSCISCTRCQASGNVEFGFKENFISNWNHRARTLDAAPSEPSAEHWRRAIKETFPFIYPESVERIEQRAREIAREGK